MLRDKGKLREEMLALRSGLGPDVARAASEAISLRLLSMPEIRAAGTVFAFWPMTDRFEVDIRPALRALVDRGVRVGLPLIRAHDDARMLEFGEFTSDTDLLPGPFGTLQPAANERIEGPAAEAVIVPALAATRAGFRLGYGGGYYDRFLAATHAFSVIPLFDACLVDCLPIEPHDRAVLAVVTETQQIRSGRSA